MKNALNTLENSQQLEWRHNELDFFFHRVKKKQYDKEASIQRK